MNSLCPAKGLGFTLFSVALTFAQPALASSTNHRFLSFRVYEEFDIKTSDGQTITLGEGALSPRPQPRPPEDWRTIGKRL